MNGNGKAGEYHQAPLIERRYSPVEIDGRRLSGVAMRYGDIARLPWGRERFSPGAFGDVRALDVVLDVQHVRSRPIARTPATLQLTDGPEALRAVATLPETREADDALTLVRAGVLRGLSVEFAAKNAPVLDGLRTVQSAALLRLGLVDSPAYPDSTVEARAFEVRQDGDGIEGHFFYDVDTVISDREAHGGAGLAHIETRQRAGVRKSRVRPGAFRFALEDETREIQAVLGRTFERPIGSRLAGTLEIEDAADALTFRVRSMPDTSYVADYRAQVAAGAAVHGVAALYRIPPPETVPDAVAVIPEEGNAEVLIEVVNQAVLTGLAIITRPPRGNAGEVAQRRRLWL